MEPAATPGMFEILAAALFGVAIVHTFSAHKFEQLAHRRTDHAGLFRLLGEVEVVFGFWALVLLGFMALQLGSGRALTYLESRSFIEPAFVLAIMVIAASRPIIDAAAAVLYFIARLLPVEKPVAYYFTILSLGPILGSFITEPAAMTLAAMLLRNQFLSRNAPATFMYATIGVLFVNVSIGGTLTHFAAPPVLMVADRWGWGTAHMLSTFGWKAAIAVLINAAGAAYAFRSYLREQPMSAKLAGTEVPFWIIAVHLVFLAGVVIFNHHPVVFIGLLLFFLGFAEAYKRHQSRLVLREATMVAFFLAGLVVLGGQQRWWLQPLLADMNQSVIFAGSTLLTAFVDNAALTYLGSLVEGFPDESKYSLVAGAVTGGGLTVIANAPNPAGFAILKGSFPDGAISAVGLATAAIVPTLVAAAAFMLLP
ncbi:MAG: putative Na+/H+ antiporter [Xanthobacteraceae bacterium]|nr:putative Na+/H+ antiporter [Xanthobacteraceae bacterium]